MPVALTISESIDGTQIADTLATSGGGQTGMDLGSVTNDSFSPIVDKPTNDGAQDLYIHHDAVVDPITSVQFFISTFTGSYAGADSAANDYASIMALGNASGDSKNNNDGLSGGVWIDQDWDVSTTNQFDYSTNGYDGTTSAGGNDTVAKFGDNGGTSNGYGSDLVNAIPLGTACQVYDAPGETVASAPVAGKIGKAADTVLGTNAHIKLRIYLPSAQAQGGIFQFDTNFVFSYTA